MSKGLEKLKTIRHIHDMECGKDESINKDFDIIEKELKEYEKMKAVKGTITFDKAIEDTLINACPNVAKKLKALEILRECNLTIDEFNKKFNFISGKVPKDKVDLLKEVLL